MNDNENKLFACNLTSLEFQKRKTSVIDRLKKEIIGKEELENGFRFKFDSSDNNLDQILSFIKTERKCCSFFEYELKISENSNTVWLSLTGQKGVKDFMRQELGF